MLPATNDLALSLALALSVGLSVLLSRVGGSGRSVVSSRDESRDQRERDSPCWSMQTSRKFERAALEAKGRGREAAGRGQGCEATAAGRRMHLWLPPQAKTSEAARASLAAARCGTRSAGEGHENARPRSARSR